MSRNDDRCYGRFQEERHSQQRRHDQRGQEIRAEARRGEQTLHFGGGVQGVVDAPKQFEPVLRAGGSWRNLPPLSAEQRVRIATILSLKAAGVLGDVSQGGLYFQNEAVVRQRAAAGQVKPSLVGFGGLPVTAKVGDHTFYRPTPAAEPPAEAAEPPRAPAGGDVRKDYAAAVEAALGGEDLP
jgi:hypothetical protein